MEREKIQVGKEGRKEDGTEGRKERRGEGKGLYKKKRNEKRQIRGKGITNTQKRRWEK